MTWYSKIKRFIYAIHCQVCNEINTFGNYSDIAYVKNVHRNKCKNESEKYFDLLTDKRLGRIGRFSYFVICNICNKELRWKRKPEVRAIRKNHRKQCEMNSQNYYEESPNKNQQIQEEFL